MPVVSLTVPKHSNPLEKSVRTLEGVLVVIPVVTSVGPGVSLKYGAIPNGGRGYPRYPRYPRPRTLSSPCLATTSLGLSDPTDPRRSSCPSSH